MYIFEIAHKSLYKELKTYEEAGIPMILSGTRASSVEIVKAHMTGEKVNYMRDYRFCPNGRIETVTFNEIFG